VWAPLVGGLLVGGVEVFVPYYLGSAAPNYVILGIALVFFAFRPEGMFSRSLSAAAEKQALNYPDRFLVGR
jgi:branched-chain amino acid transport system permease protein